MSASAEALLHQALQLSINDRAALVEGLITSLDKPDPELDALWLKEAESRMAAYRAGELGAVDADEVFAELEKSLEDKIPAPRTAGTPRDSSLLPDTTTTIG